jgi:hypothetical protein
MVPESTRWTVDTLNQILYDKTKDGGKTCLKRQYSIFQDNKLLAGWLRKKGKHYDRRSFINNHIKYLQDLLRYGEHNNK